MMFYTSSCPEIKMRKYLLLRKLRFEDEDSQDPRNVGNTAYICKMT